MYTRREMGLVSDIFDEEALQEVKGHAAIGHVRYSTAGSSSLKNAQPFVVEYSKGPLAIAHNGNLTNAKIIRDELQNYGSIFQSTMDTEVIVHLIALSHENLTLDRLISALRRVEGSYSLLLLTDKEMIAVRDPYGFRPLVLGKLKDSYAVVERDLRLRPDRGGLPAGGGAGRGDPHLARTASVPIPRSRRRSPAAASSNTSISPGLTARYTAGPSTA